MGRFVTANSRIEQTNVPGYWRTIDNELYLDVEYYSDNLVILHSSEVPISGKVIVTRI